MARKIIDTGIVGNDGTGDSIRDSFRKVNDNFRELYSSLGLGDRLQFINLDDVRFNAQTPPYGDSGSGIGYTGSENRVVIVNEDESGVTFKQIVGVNGINVVVPAGGDSIELSAKFAALYSDKTPQLGADLNAAGDGENYTIYNLPEPTADDQVSNKAYADRKVSLSGVDTIDPSTGNIASEFGTMTGPLILSRDPVASDDDTYDGLIAATKRYVDSSAFGSSVNLYVATSGQDERVGVGKEIQGRALAYAYRSLEGALKRAEEIMLESRSEIGPYKKVLTYGGNITGAVIITVGNPTVFTTPNHGLEAGAIISFSSTGQLPEGLIEGDEYYVIANGLTPDTFRISETRDGAEFATSSEQSGLHDFRASNPTRRDCTLTSITEAPGGGSGFAGDIFLSVDTIKLNNSGNYYRVGDIVEIAGGVGAQPASVEVLSTATTPGAIVTFRLVSSGVYSTLPLGSSNTNIDILSTCPGNLDTAVSPATFDLTYKVNSINITNNGSGYGLVSVRISGGGGNNAFGTADIDPVGNGSTLLPGNIASITITDPGSGFITKPSFEVDLPRFSIFTAGLRTDFTGNVSEDSEIAKRSRDVREGLYLYGETSGALAQILQHTGELDLAGNELFDVDIVYGTFQIGEVISYGDVTKNTQISILIESGIYEENLPLRIPQNVALIGDEFRRTIIRPKAGVSSSPWAFIHFRRDTEIDGLAVTDRLYGYHYLTDKGSPVWPIVNNAGYYNAASSLLTANKTFIQTEVVAWINYNIENGIAPFNDPLFVANGYNENLCKRDVGLLIDAMAFDLKWGLHHRTVSAALKYKSNASGRIAITDQLSQTSASIAYVNTLAQFVIANTSVPTRYSTALQIIDNAFIAELGSADVVEALVNTVINIIEDSDGVNYPLDNDEMDVFLCNDAVIGRAMTIQGHGGFAVVLDPEGQVLAKSPYFQEGAVFSKSSGRKRFSGGMFVDGFCGNLQFQIDSKLSDTRLRISRLKRRPELPCSFIENDTVYRINYIRDFVFSPDGCTATFVLDETTPYTPDLFVYDKDICSRDVGLILTGLGWDIVTGSNYHARKSGLSYRQAHASVVIEEQLAVTLVGIKHAHDEAFDNVGNYAPAQNMVLQHLGIMEDIVSIGVIAAPELELPAPLGLSAEEERARILLLANIEFIKAETIGRINAIYGSLVYNNEKCARDVEYIASAAIYDLVYGGNSESVAAGYKYFDGVGNAVVDQIPGTQTAATIAGINWARDVARQAVLNLAPSTVYSTEPRVTGTPTDSTTADALAAKFDIVTGIINTGGFGDPIDYPTVNDTIYDASLIEAQSRLNTNSAVIRSKTIDYIDEWLLFEVLTPGNRSMLSNDFTQICDMGYGLIATNGGLTEAVSMFTYYCHISYYSINGGQIRSVGGSSSHGNFALIAEGSDPLEVPTPVSLFFDLSQGATCYFPSPEYANTVDGLVIYITNYTYPPLDKSELEVAHGTAIYRYALNSVTTTDMPPGVAKCNISTQGSDSGSGLYAVVNDGDPLTIRCNSQVVLTGDIVQVATRPSTALLLNETDTIYRVLQFQDYTDPTTPTTFTVSISASPADPALFTCVNHRLLAGYMVKFTTTGSLPTGLVPNFPYYVIGTDLTANTFRLSDMIGGQPIVTSGSQSGVHKFIVAGLGRTTLRENYDYIELTGWVPQPFVGPTTNCTFSIANPTLVSATSHGLSIGDCVKFESTETLPIGISAVKHYFVIATDFGPDSFKVSLQPGGTAAGATVDGTGTYTVGKVIGRAGDSAFAVVPVGPKDKARVRNTKFVFLGEEYTILRYNDETATGEPYALITLNRPLVDSILPFNSAPTLKAGVPKRSPGASGTLTIRISLTRVTSHDLLEIGTGSYADTNYPSEIYGGAVNPLNDANEAEERGSGRVFYVTTDQFGNFSVGPYFRVDQGTGTVTFSASIALSNLDGLGFKRGVPISEFSTDSSFSDNATDTVPTENATRIYIERRLGLSHTGVAVSESQLIPVNSGGFLPLAGTLGMKANLNFNYHKGINLTNPTLPQDAVNLRSLTFDNFQDVEITNLQANDILTFTGVGNAAINTSIVGDISLTIDSTANTLDAQINPGVIVNNDVNDSAAIAQSKLAMNAATTRDDPVGIVQADRGLSSFDNAQFTVTNGWVTLKLNGTPLSKLNKVAGLTVLGNAGDLEGSVTAVTMSDAVDLGRGIQKKLYTTTGYLRYKGPLVNENTSYEIVEEDSNSSANTLVKRNSSGDFKANVVTISQLKVDDKLALDTEVKTVSSGYTKLYSYLENAAILIGDGSNPTDKVTLHYNDSHEFRPRNGTGYAPIFASSVRTKALKTDSETDPGQITGNWSLVGTSRMQATYSADLAEFYEGDKEYPVGTVLVFGGDKEVTITTTRGDYRVAGVVSDNAAYSMYGACPGFKNQIALQGRVPCRVAGKIRKGDLLITSHIAGVAVSAGARAETGTVIGKALQDYDSDHIGTIEVAVGRN